MKFLRHLHVILTVAIFQIFQTQYCLKSDIEMLRWLKHETAPWLQEHSGMWPASPSLSHVSLLHIKYSDLQMVLIFFEKDGRSFANCFQKVNYST